MSKMKPLLGLFLIVLALTSVPSLQAQSQPSNHNFSLQAISGDGQSVMPYFVLDGVTGGQLTGQVQIVNRGESLGSVQLYTVDAVTGNTGGTVLKMHEDALTEAGSWIQLERDVVTLAPGEGQLIPFVVTIPTNIRSGAHVGGIVMEPVDGDLAGQDAVQDEVSFQVEVKTRTAVAVQVNLPGAPVEQLDVHGLAFGGHDSRQILYLNLRNSGTEMLKPIGSLQIIDAHGQRLQDYRFNIDTFLPENEIEYPIYVEGEALPAGSYTADLSLRYGETAQIYRNQLDLTITEADNIQIFEGREVLASPLVAKTNELFSNRSTAEIFVMGGLGFLLIALAIYLVVQIIQRQQVKKQQ